MKALAAFAAIAALVLAIVAPWSTAQTTSTFTAAGTNRTWPPHPSAMFGWSTGPSGSGIPAGGDLVIATVPQDAWLVLNGGVWAPYNTGRPGVYERTNGGDILKCAEGYGTSAIIDGNQSSPVGLTFGPGSELVIKNAHASEATNMGYTTLLGYWVRN